MKHFNANEVKDLREHFAALPYEELRQQIHFLSRPTVRRVRLLLGLSQQKMSWEMGCTEGTVKRLEREHRLPSQRAFFDTFRRIAGRVGVELDAIPSIAQRRQGGCCIDELMLACDVLAQKEAAARRMVEAAFSEAEGIEGAIL